MDTTKVGVAAAMAMEEIQELVDKGIIPENAYVGAAYMIVALDHEIPDAHEKGLRSPATQCFVFGTPEQLYIQNGLLHMALDNYSDPDDMTIEDD
jgi:hypothetical protein